MTHSPEIIWLDFHWKDGRSRFWAMFVFPPRTTKHFMLLILLLCWCTHTRTKNRARVRQGTTKNTQHYATLVYWIWLDSFFSFFIVSIQWLIRNVIEYYSCILEFCFSSFFFVLPREASTVKSSPEKRLVASSRIYVVVKKAKRFIEFCGNCAAFFFPFFLYLDRNKNSLSNEKFNNTLKEIRILFRLVRRSFFSLLSGSTNSYFL